MKTPTTVQKLSLQQGDRDREALAYGNLDILYETRGELGRAVDCWKQSLTLFQQLGAKDQVALVQSWLDAIGQKGVD